MNTIKSELTSFIIAVQYGKSDTSPRKPEREATRSTICLAAAHAFYLVKNPSARRGGDRCSPKAGQSAVPNFTEFFIQQHLLATGNKLTRTTANRRLQESREAVRQMVLAGVELRDFAPLIEAPLTPELLVRKHFECAVLSRTMRDEILSARLAAMPRGL